MHFNQCLQSRKNGKRQKKVKDLGPVETERLILLFFYHDHANQPHYSWPFAWKLNFSLSLGEKDKITVWQLLRLCLLYNCKISKSSKSDVQFSIEWIKLKVSYIHTSDSGGHVLCPWEGPGLCPMLHTTENKRVAWGRAWGKTCAKTKCTNHMIYGGNP